MLFSHQIARYNSECGIMYWVMKDGKILRDIPKPVAGNTGGAKEEPKQDRRVQALRSCHARRREKPGGDFGKNRISYFNSK